MLVQLRLTEKQLEQALEDQARADEELGSLREEVQYLRYVQSHNPSSEGTSEQARVDREQQNPTAQSRRLEECENEIEENRQEIDLLTERVLSLNETKINMTAAVDFKSEEIDRLSHELEDLRAVVKEVTSQSEKWELQARHFQMQTQQLRQQQSSTSDLPVEDQTSNSNSDIKHLQNEVERLNMVILEKDRTLHDERRAWHKVLYGIESRILSLQKDPA